MSAELLLYLIVLMFCFRRTWRMMVVVSTALCLALGYLFLPFQFSFNLILLLPASSQVAAFPQKEITLAKIATKCRGTSASKDPLQAPCNPWCWSASLGKFPTYLLCVITAKMKGKILLRNPTNSKIIFDASSCSGCFLPFL